MELEQLLHMQLPHMQRMRIVIETQTHTHTRAGAGAGVAAIAIAIAKLPHGDSFPLAMVVMVRRLRRRTFPVLPAFQVSPFQVQVQVLVFPWIA